MNSSHIGPTTVNAEFPLPPLLEDGHCPNVVELLRQGQLCFHHQVEELGCERINWRLGPQATARLWAITLHYHGWAFELAKEVEQGNREAAELWTRYVSDWLRQCHRRQPGAAALAWNSYAIATRIGFWIRGYQLLRNNLFQERPAFAAEFLGSLWEQARFLHANLEWDLRANHLLRDAVGLAWAGRFFRGSEPKSWLKTATKLAASQIAEQVLSDGGHFERSPHYHLEVMRDVLALVFLIEDKTVNDSLRRTWDAMAEYVAWLRHPDGSCPQFNDAGATRPNEVLGLLPLDGERNQRGRRTGGRHFAQTGIVAWHGDPWTLFLDVGKIGPDCQPGHGHADTLTLECSLGEHRLFVDPGCHSYDDDLRRRYDRGTDSHNTVCIDGLDSSEVWHIFRVGRRARPLAARTENPCGHSMLRATGSHNGYDYLPGSPRHTRTIEVHDAGPLEITDTISGREIHEITGGFLLAPEWQATPIAGGWKVTNGEATARVFLSADREVTSEIQLRPLHPDYGLERETQRLAWRYRGPLPLRVTTRIDPTT